LRVGLTQVLGARFNITANLEDNSMKALALSITLGALSAAAMAAPSQATSSESNYTAERQPDGSIQLTVTGQTEMPPPPAEAKLELATMLEAAASRECPSGYELTQDPAPTVRVDGGTLVGTLRGFARCK
jgi:hypothetical protein